MKGKFGVRIFGEALIYENSKILENKMKNLEKEINKIWDLAVYLQMIAAFCNDLDFNKYKKLMLEFHRFIKESNEDEIKVKLNYYKNKLNKIADPIKIKYPLKRDYKKIAIDWNDKFKNDKEVFSNGVMIGWLEEQMDLTNYKRYDYFPYQFKVGLVLHKGRGEIEENFLLLDSFACLVKAKKQLTTLEEFGKKHKKIFNSQGKTEFDKETLDALNKIKYEVSFYSRLTIISFFSFLESFINSIGFDYYYRNKNTVNSSDEEILQGSKKGRFLSLKHKIEKFQKIIRPDKEIKIILTDDKQIKEPFKSLFEEYEELRNSSVHFSPIKSRIWLKPHDWFDRAEKSSHLVIDAALQIWKCCHNTSKGPDYLGRLDFNDLYESARLKNNEILKIENDL